MKKIIFYYPHELSNSPTKGSELRPVLMKKAFKSIGYKVETVVGNSVERKKSIKKIKAMINEGEKFEFLYAESSNMPVPISDSHHLPLRIFQDYNFFRFLNKNSVPIGLFCRDLYWRFKEFKYNTSIKLIIKNIFHWIEWKGICKTVDHLFLPTNSIASYLPKKLPAKNVSALYPGCNVEKSINVNKKSSKKFNLFYVGGVKPPYYDLRPILEVVNLVNNINLILCTRKKEWEQNKLYYKDYNFENISIVHANSNEISQYYQSSDLVLDIRKPIGYFKTALPIKIIEALGYEVPLLLIDGTESAEFVKRENVGWVVSNSTEAIILLEKINKNRKLLDEKVKKIKEVKKNHTWKSRANEAARTLVQYN